MCDDHSLAGQVGNRSTMRFTCVLHLGRRRELFLTLGYLLLAACISPLRAADSPQAAPTRKPAFACGNENLTVEKVMAGRYPNPELLNAPDACKQRAQQRIEKWRQEDLANWETLAGEACSAELSSAQWLLEQTIVKTQRETEMLDLGCDCYGEILSQATNAPSAPGNLAIAGQTSVLSQRLDEKSAQLPIRYSPEVAARRANAGIARNAEEIMKTLAGKNVLPAEPKILDVEVSGESNNQYKTALKALMAEAQRIQTLSIETGQANSQLVTRDLPQTRRRLQEQARLLAVAYDGVVHDRELPHGQCYEAFAIRHQVMLNFVQQLLKPGSTGR